MQRPEEKLPELSATLHNCSVHAITPEIKELVLALGKLPNGNHKAYEEVTKGNYSAYELLKTTFAEHYGINPKEFNWQDFSRTLQHYNAWDVQHVLGPVLRKFMAKIMNQHVADSDVSDIARKIRQGATENQLTPKAYVTYLTEMLPQNNLNYTDLESAEVFEYIGSQLGFNIVDSGPPLEAAEPLKTINMYHQAGVQGARNAQHWERTESEAERDIFNGDREQQKLFEILELVTSGNDPLRFQNGLDLLKLDVQTAFKSQDQVSYLTNTKDIKEAAQKIKEKINQIALKPEFYNLSATEQLRQKDDLSRSVTSEIQKLTNWVAELPSVPIAKSANLSATADPRARQASLAARPASSADNISSLAGLKDDLTAISPKASPVPASLFQRQAHIASTTQEPSTKTDPSASLVLNAAIVQSNRLNNVKEQDAFIEQHNSTPEPTDKQKNLVDMFAALIILRNKGVFEVKPSYYPSVKSQQEHDEEMARELQKKEFEIEQQREDSVFKPRH